jgi:Ca2+-binding RTX toxin-like protein
VNVENFIGTNLADTFIGDAQNNYFQGYNDNDVMRGGAGNDTLEGGGGIDQLFGGADNDRLAGGFDNDTLTGELGADAFVFRSIANGQDRITDFHIDQGDYIDFSEHAAVNSMTDLTITTEGGNAVIHYGADSITLDGVQALDIRADWFHF